MLLKKPLTVTVATMTHDHDDTPMLFLTPLLVPARKWLKLSILIWRIEIEACQHVSHCDFFSVYQNSIIKDDENRVLRIFANLLFMDSWKWSKWAIYKFICLEILFLLTHNTQASDIAVMKSGTRNDFQSSCLYDTLKKLSPWHTFSNMAKISHRDSLFQIWLK